jgi:hypothetical protein
MPRIVWDSATDGHWVDDNDEIEDGKTIRVPMATMPFLRDSKRTQLTDTFRVDGVDLDLHRPGHRLLDAPSRAAVSNARQEMIDRACNGWKDLRHAGSPRTDAVQTDAHRNARPSQENSHQRPAHQGYDAGLGGERFRLDDIRRPSLEARADYVRRLQDAWRSPATTLLPLPETRTGLPRANERHSVRDVTPAEHQARRDKAYQSYCTELSNAWRSPAGQVRPQPALTAVGPSGFVEATASGDPAARAAAIEKLGEQTRGGA